MKAPKPKPAASRRASTRPSPQPVGGSGVDFAAIGRKGGSATTATSPAKAQALRTLHAARRGVRIHADDPNRQQVLDAVRSALSRPVRGHRSIRALAAYLGVSDPTVRRWLAGVDWPNSLHIRSMRTWCNEVASAS